MPDFVNLILIDRPGGGKQNASTGDEARKSG
jgi:hypothetical protein